MALTLVVSFWAATAQARPLIIGNNDIGPGFSGTIVTYDFTGGAVVGFFFPTGENFATGQGVVVLGNRIYYTGQSLRSPTAATDFIRIAPFNGGAGGADIGTLPNPRPGFAVQDLAVHNGVLYALTGLFIGAPQVFGLNPVTGAVVSGPVPIAAPAGFTSDGFTVLPNGNFLINDSLNSCTYRQYTASAGASVPASTIVVPGASSCTGVDTDGTSLFFQTDHNSFTKTTLAGTLISRQPVEPAGMGGTNPPPDQLRDISLVTLGCAGRPGRENCRGTCIASLATTYGSIHNASSVLGYASVAALRDAVRAFLREAFGA